MKSNQIVLRLLFDFIIHLDVNWIILKENSSKPDE